MVKEKILIIDDEEIVRSSLKNALEYEEYIVDTAVTGTEGVEKIRKGSYEVTLLDLKLPDKDGIDVLRDIRNYDSEMAVILITGYGTIDAAKDAMRFGAFDFITKPINPDDLFVVIKKALAQRKKEREKGFFEKPDVLVVDDSDRDRELIRTILIDNGYNTETAKSGEDALKKIRRKKYHVIVTDLVMPGMDGIELIENIRRIRGQTFLPIVISDSPTIESAVDALRKGAYDYLSKPIKPDELINTIVKGWDMMTIDVLLSKILKAGRNYLVTEKKPDRSFQLFSEMINHGFHGLCITLHHPDHVRKKYGLDNCIILWLSKTERFEGKSIHPSKLGSLVTTISNFVENTERSVVLLDGLENLITTNGFETTLKYLHEIWETILLTNSWLILPVNPAALDTRELAILERNMEPLAWDVELMEYMRKL